MDNKLKAAIYGLAIGDAVGVPFEFRTRGTFYADDMIGYGTYDQPVGTWSDDTSLTLATCHSIKENGGVNIADMRGKFTEWMVNGEYAIAGNVFDIGDATAEALEKGEGLSDFYSNGNGSLMRIIPLAFTKNSPALIAEVSGITHAHHISQDICQEYIVVASKLLEGQNIREAIVGCSGRVPTIFELDESDIKSTGFVVDTFEAAVWVVSTTDNFKDAILKAVNLGDDTDTVAAVAGGLAGIIYGLEGIPAEWIDKLLGKDIIDSCLF